MCVEDIFDVFNLWVKDNSNNTLTSSMPVRCHRKIKVMFIFKLNNFFKYHDKYQHLSLISPTPMAPIQPPAHCHYIIRNYTKALSGQGLREKHKSF
jgi:hypothetical protein